MNLKYLKSSVSYRKTIIIEEIRNTNNVNIYMYYNMNMKRFPKWPK